MGYDTDTGIFELLASKICHDLISPIGAVNNGVEILEEMGPEAGPDVTELIAFSAGQASAKLQVYRLAYAAGGADTNLKPEDVYNAIQNMISRDEKITQDWDPHADMGFDEYPKGFCKLLTCAFLLGMDCLPKGGTISVSGENAHVLITAAGENAHLRDKTIDALSLEDDEDLRQPKYIHAICSALLARHYGFELSVAETGGDFVRFSLHKAA